MLGGTKPPLAQTSVSHLPTPFARSAAHGLPASARVAVLLD